jgi:hypothetical protein
MRLASHVETHHQLGAFMAPGRLVADWGEPAREMPYDLYEKVISKVEEYLASGVRQVWLISSEHNTITIYSSPTHTTILTEADDLVSEGLLPGFRCRIADLFRSPAGVRG